MLPVKNKITLDGLLGGLEAKTDVLVVTKALVGLLGAGNSLLGRTEDGGLLLESLLGLKMGERRMLPVSVFLWLLMFVHDHVCFNRISE